jgi:plastocyanin
LVTGAVIVMLAALLFGRSDVSAAPAPQAGNAVEIKDFQFSPNALTVPVGTTVTWTNTGQAPHTATAKDNSFDTGILNNGQSKAITFDKEGTFEYVCLVHPRMTATLTVGNAQASPAASAAPSASAAPAGPTPSVEANDQAVDGGSVTVARVVAAQDGWIVIHTNTADNAPGPVIGHTAVKAGENTNVKVALSQAVAAGAKLWPMLHIDAGAIGTYEVPGPDSPVQANGQIVMKQITITAGAAAPAASAPAASAPAAGAPSSLPNTGANDPQPFGLALLAGLVVLTGAGLVLGSRRRAAR